jgi:predicted dehydrogenase
MTKRIGIIGAGTMGGRYAAALAGGDFAGATLAGVCDINGEAARRVADQFGVPAFDDPAALCRKAGPDAFYLATPDALHREPALAVFAEGVAALIEKPLATTEDDARAIVEAAARAGVVAEVNFSNRWNPPFVQAHAAREQLGEPVTVTARLNNVIASPRDRLAWSGRTTPAWFLMSHCLDLAYWLHGRPARRVYATGRRGALDALGIDTWDTIQALVTYDGGSTGSFEATWVLPESHPSPIEFEFRLVGTRGAVTVDTTHQLVRIATDSYRTPPTLAWAPQRFRSFLAALDGGPPGCPLADGLENTRLLVAIHRSLVSGAVETLD